MDIATHPNPAKKPAIAPQLAVVLASFKNIARLKAITIEKRNVSPKILDIFPFFKSSSVNLFSFIHTFPKSSGEYQSPPIKKFESAAVITANQLSVEMSIIIKFSDWSAI